MPETLCVDFLDLPEPGDSFSQIRICLISRHEYRFPYHAGSTLGVFERMPFRIVGDPTSSHVIPGLISKFLNAKKKKLNVEVWGSGRPSREFLHVDDLANAIFTILKVDKKKSIKSLKENYQLLILEVEIL